jgi:hypothetical protein
MIAGFGPTPGSAHEVKSESLKGEAPSHELAGAKILAHEKFSGGGGEAPPEPKAAAKPEAKPNVPTMAKGNYDVPEDMVAQIHKGEMVVPAHVAHGMRSALGDEGSMDRSAMRKRIARDRGDVDEGMTKTVSVDASGRVQVNVAPGAPAGAGRRLFKRTAPERPTQMVYARSGPYVGAAEFMGPAGD